MKKLFSFIIASMLALSAHANNIVMSTGAKDGTYFDMAVQLLRACPPKEAITIVTSNGSIDNIDAVFHNNTAMFGISQIDALYAEKVDPDVVQVLFALHPEQVHIIVSTEPRKVPTGMFSKLVGGGNPLTLNSSSDLAKLNIGSWGGSIVTTSILNDKLGWNANIVDTGNADNALNGLLANKLDAIIYVAGTGNKFIADLPMDKFKFLPVNDSDASKLSGMFSKDNITYTNLKVRGLPTVSAQSVVITKVNKKGQVSDIAKDLQSCFYAKLDDIQTTPKVRVNWDQVKKPGEDGYVTPKWKVWSPAAAPTTKAKK